MPKARLTSLIERESVLSNWYDLSRGFTAALAVTPYPGAVSQSILSSITHPGLACAVSHSGLYIYHRHLHSTLFLLLPRLNFSHTLQSSNYPRIHTNSCFYVFDDVFLAIVNLVRRCAATASILASAGSTASSPLHDHHREIPDYGSSISTYLQHPSTTADERVPPRGNGKETTCTAGTPATALCLCQYSNCLCTDNSNNTI